MRVGCTKALAVILPMLAKGCRFLTTPSAASAPSPSAEGGRGERCSQFLRSLGMGTRAAGRTNAGAILAPESMRHGVGR